MELVVVLYFSTILTRTQGVVYKVGYEEVSGTKGVVYKVRTHTKAFHRWTL
jgi:hypothetical protein